MVVTLQIVWSLILLAVGTFIAYRFVPQFFVRYREAWRSVWGERGWWLFLLPGLLVIVMTVVFYVAVRDWWKPRAARRWAEMHEWAESDGDQRSD
jgi:hypothetical protein